MGVWGAGLYSGDFARDLRSAIAAISRLPFGGDRLVEILCEMEPTAANHPDDEEHTTFWLVVADQLEKRGIISDLARGSALRIIDQGSDIATLARLGMVPSGLKKRQEVLAELRGRLTAPASKPRRPTLNKPQAFLMEIGDIFVYPSSGGRCINSYFTSKERMTGWKQDGWNAALIVDRGLAFDFLAWYRPVTAAAASVEKPSLAALLSTPRWILRRPGTCSAVHFETDGTGKDRQAGG